MRLSFSFVTTIIATAYSMSVSVKQNEEKNQVKCGMSDKVSNLLKETELWAKTLLDEDV